MADGCFYIKKEHRSIIPSADRAGGGLLFDHRLDTNATVERRYRIYQFRSTEHRRDRGRCAPGLFPTDESVQQQGDTDEEQSKIYINGARRAHRRRFEYSTTFTFACTGKHRW